MLSESKVRWVRGLLADGLSHRAIQKVTGVSRHTIGKIARRRRPDGEPLDQLQQPEGQAPEPAPRPIRCPECGHQVYPPCRACQIRKALADGQLRQVFRNAHLAEPVGLDLLPEHQDRYERLLARRRRPKPREPDAS